MPQLDTSNFLSQIFWLIITFAVLYCYLQRFILPKLGGIISQRASAVAGDLEQADELQDAIASLEQKIAAEFHVTNERVVAMHKEAAAKIHATKQVQLDEINIAFLKKQQLVTTEITKAKKTSMDQMQNYVIDYSALIIKKITGEKPDVKVLEQYYLKLEARS